MVMDIPLVIVLLSIWAVTVTIIALAIWFKIMPVIRELRKEPGGDLTITKTLFPPRFHK